MRSLVVHTTDPVEKARILYDYLQKNFRYVSIQLGIGGFKPFPASFTDAKKYGDCKALSNYMQACLAAVNIKSYQALINAGNNKAPVDPSFPVNGFNHDILCIPMANDSLWLECTSNYNDFGKLGNFTENRNALLITENGGVLVPTPKSKSHDNRLLTKEIIQLDEDGAGKVRVDMQTSGEFKSAFINMLYNESKDDQKYALFSMLDLPASDNFEITLSDDREKTMLDTKLDLSFEKVTAFTAGSKMFLNSHLFKIWNKSLPNTTNRKKDFYFPNPLEKSDTTIYQLPAGYVVESMPKPTDISFKYGEYHSKTWQDAGSGNIISIASVILKQHIIPVADFSATKKFCSQMIEDEVQKIVIRKQ